MTNAEIIWTFLMDKIGNPFGVAGLMGNLNAESALNPINLQNTYEKKLGMTDASYTAAVDDGSYTNFAKDSAGYGLAQWTYHSRKQNLLNYAKEKGTSIGDLGMQLEFLWKELGSYKTVLSTLKEAKSIQEASDVVLIKFEKPANQGDSVKMARAKYGQRFYDAYAVKNELEKTEGSDVSTFTNLEFAEFCLAVFAAKWSYWFGTCGYKCTNSLYKSKKKQYPSYYTDAKDSKFKKDIAEGKMCADCVGLIKAFFWLGGKLDGTNKYASNNCPDYSATGIYERCSKNGPIDTIPDVPGLVVWKKGHIGVYVGGGYTVEMKGSAYGCVKNKVTEGSKWTNWGQLPSSMLNYVTGEVQGVAPTLGERILEVGDKGEDVIQLQTILVELGYNLGSYGSSKNGVDGTFGTKTQNAVMAFQMANGLTASGIVDSETVKHLKPEKEILPETEEQTPSQETRVVEITAEKLNTRIGDSQKYESIGYANKGDQFEWIATSSTTGWYAIRTQNQICWVSPNYSKLLVVGTV